MDGLRLRKPVVDCPGAHRAVRMSGVLITLVLVFMAARAWSQQVDVRELDTTAGYVARFQNYQGHEPVVESIPQIEGIGEVLSRNLRADSGRGD